MRNASDLLRRPTVGGDQLAQYQRCARPRIPLRCRRLRDAEHGEHTGADAAIGATTEVLHRVLHAALEFVRQQVGFLGIEPCFQLG